jgi:two-component system response regulator NreC
MLQWSQPNHPAEAVFQVKLLIVDDHAVVRTGLAALLNGKHGIEVVGEAADGDEGIAKSLRLKPDVVLMDLNMPHGKDGLAQQPNSDSRRPTSRCLT